MKRTLLSFLLLFLLSAVARAQDVAPISRATVEATGGNSTTSLAARFGHILNLVDDFGADPAGVNDSGAALAAVFGYADSLSVTVPCGTYLISSTERFVTNQNLAILGANASCVIFSFPPATTVSQTIFQFGFNRSGIWSGITLDLVNVSVSFGTVLAIGANTDNLSVTGNLIKNISANMFGIGISNASLGFNFSDNILSAASPINSDNNGAVFVGGTGSANGFIRHNTLTNIGMEVNGSYIVIDGNTCNTWGQAGACLETSADAVNSFSDTITNNIAHGDVEGGSLECMELWSNRSIIANNQLFNCPGDGLDIGGNNDLVTDNLIYGAGASTGASAGIVHRWSSSTVNANGTYYSGNQVFDGGGGTTQYGFADQAYGGGIGCDQGVNTCSAIFGINNFAGILGPMQIRTSGDVYAPSINGLSVSGKTSTGSANTQVLGLTSPQIMQSNLVAGLSMTFTPGYTNTGAATLNVATSQVSSPTDSYDSSTKSTGALIVERLESGSLAALEGGEIVAGIPLTVWYNGSIWILR